MTTRTRGLTLAASVLVVAAGVWIGSQTYWDELTVPMPARGEAASNPTYAAQRFIERLGATSRRRHVLAAPSAADVIVLSTWNLGLDPGRRTALERWVESGGRLVVDGTVRLDADFSRWSGIAVADLDGRVRRDRRDDVPCQQFEGISGARHWLCDFQRMTQLKTDRPPLWQLHNASFGIQAVGMRVGAGSVGVVNGDLFRDRRVFDGDHGWLLVTAAGLGRGDIVHFVSEGDYPSLLALIWQYGAPVVSVLLVLLLLRLWRDGVRFGPLEREPDGARRSLAEQIRGTGSFVFRHGGGTALYEATVRALDGAARQRIPGYATLPAQARTAALARVTGLGGDALAEALFHPGSQRQASLPATIALLETARRRVLRDETVQTKVAHGRA